MIGIIDYGVGNLRSVEKAYEHLGFKCKIISSPKETKDCDKLILPGVGAFSLAMKNLKESEFDLAIHDFISTGKYFLGICLGQHLLFEESEEFGNCKGLGVYKGKVVKISDKEKIPHMCWNDLNIKKPQPLFENLENAYVYFVHSFIPKPTEEIVSATTFYGEELAVAVQDKNVFALQFHPEKSGETGLTILKNFGRL